MTGLFCYCVSLGGRADPAATRTKTQGAVGISNYVILFHNDSPTLLKVMHLPSATRQFIDRFGATGSLLCAVHCALLPALLAVAPALGLSFWLSDGVEATIVIFVT